MLLHDFGGCDAAAVVRAVGCELSDLFPKSLPANELRQRGPAPIAKPAATVVEPSVSQSLNPFWRERWRTFKAVIPGTTAERYLRARGCAIPPPDGDLRCTEELRHPVTGHVGPALVALVTHAETGEPLTLHRTWICGDGRKADCQPPRMLLGRHTKAGGVIRLWPDESVTMGLSIAEGIETALAVGAVSPPVWSCIDAGNMAALPVLNGIESLLLVADNDDAGLRAARSCAARWHAAGVSVRLAIPPQPGTDAADLAQQDLTECAA